MSSSIAYVFKNFEFAENPWIQAVKFGNLELVKILYENSIPGFEDNGVLEYSVTFPEIFQYLLEKYDIVTPDKFDDEFKEWIIYNAVFYGDVEFMQWVQEYFNLVYTEEALRLSLQTGCMDKIDFIYKKTGFVNMDITSLQIYAMLHLDAEIANWFYKRFSPFMDIEGILSGVTEKIQLIREEKGDF